jgi:recombination associated protein RdgC
MDLVDLIAEKRFIGQEFLTWLWWKSEERGGSVALPDQGDITVVFEKHLLLEYGEGESSEKCICSGLQSELKEARTGLVMGKKVEQARIQLIKDDYEWNFTMAAAVMEFRNVRLPKTGPAAEGGDSPEEQEGMILERIFLFEELIRLVQALFRMFLEIRVGNDWKDELVKVRKWVHHSGQMAEER